MQTQPPDKIICHSCMRWHFPPKCNWPSESPCPSCRLPLGYKGDDAQGDECFWCWSGFRRGGGAASEKKAAQQLASPSIGLDSVPQTEP